MPSQRLWPPATPLDQAGATLGWAWGTEGRFVPESGISRVSLHSSGGAVASRCPFGAKVLADGGFQTPLLWSFCLACTLCPLAPTLGYRAASRPGSHKLQPSPGQQGMGQCKAPFSHPEYGISCTRQVRGPRRWTAAVKWWESPLNPVTMQPFESMISRGPCKNGASLWISV